MIAQAEEKIMELAQAYKLDEAIELAKESVEMSTYLPFNFTLPLPFNFTLPLVRDLTHAQSRKRIFGRC